MIIYFITQPQLSAGLRRSYNKHLEVHEYEAECCKDLSYQYSEPIYKIKALKATHVWKNKKWHRTTKGAGFSRGKQNQNNSYRTSEIASNASSQSCVFSSLEAAQAAKLLAIQQLADQYKKELQDIQKLSERNIPNIDKPLTELLENRPDIFI